jgi:hypothetical protein
MSGHQLSPKGPWVVIYVPPVGPVSIVAQDVPGKLEALRKAKAALEIEEASIGAVALVRSQDGQYQSKIKFRKNGFGKVERIDHTGLGKVAR